MPGSRGRWAGGQAEPNTLQGHLHKQGVLNRRWKRRWFVLPPGKRAHLLYYEERSAEAPVEAVRFDSVSEQPECTSLDGRTVYAFHITGTTGGSFSFNKFMRSLALSDGKGRVAYRIAAPTRHVESSKKHADPRSGFDARLMLAPVSSPDVPIPDLIVQSLRANDNDLIVRDSFHLGTLQQIYLNDFGIMNSDVAIEVTSTDMTKGHDGLRELYVLPSQLNGAEYKSFSKGDLVSWLYDYIHDYTGGPAGQQAGHPAIAQVIIDNAQNMDTEARGHLGFLYTRGVSSIRVFNGYMQLNRITAEQIAEFRQRAHLLSVLVSRDVPAEGFKKRDTSKKDGVPGPQFHSTTPRKLVDFMYASAAPANGIYGSPDPDDPESVLSGLYDKSVELAKLLLLVQYAAAFQQAARTVARDNAAALRTYVESPHYTEAQALQRDPGRREEAKAKFEEARTAAGGHQYKLRLLPVGGSAFLNDQTWIRDAIVLAYGFVKLHAPRDIQRALELVDVKVLTFHGAKDLGAAKGHLSEGDYFKMLFNIGADHEAKAESIMSAKAQLPKTKAQRETQKAVDAAIAKEASSHWPGFERSEIGGD